MTKNLILHSDRALIEISGKDRKQFIQGLITNDINQLNQQPLIYAAMLTPNGRFLYDFFIFESADSLMIDCFKERAEEIIRKLSFYKLRSDVVISAAADYQIGQIFERNNAEKIFPDPRRRELGYRIYGKNLVASEAESVYHQKRIMLKVAESEHDLTYEKSIILEYGFDDLNAIDYKKGCYLGQELIARTHHSGQIRKKLVALKISAGESLKKGTELLLKPVNSNTADASGVILSSTRYSKQEFYALALIKTDSEIENYRITASDFPLHVIAILA